MVDIGEFDKVTPPAKDESRTKAAQELLLNHVPQALSGQTQCCYCDAKGESVWLSTVRCNKRVDMEIDVRTR